MKKTRQKMLWIVLAAGIVSLLVFIADNGQKLPKDKDGFPYIERNGHGEGVQKEELRVRFGEDETSYTVEVQEQTYTEEELREVFRDAEKELEKLILGKNKSLDEVRNNLNLVTEIPDTGIRVAWETDNYHVMTTQGILQKDKLSEQGTLVELKAILSYGEEREEYNFYARVLSEKKSKDELFLQSLDAEVAKKDEESKSSRYQILPDKVDGKEVCWNYTENFRAVGILLIGMVLAVFMAVSEKQKEKERQEKRAAQLMLDYPQMISSLTLFLGAGMTVRNAWYRLAEEYERKKEEHGKREVYEEMVYTMHEIKGGASEAECYERFGERCGLQPYRKFGVLLSQNLKKGTRGLTTLLKQEADNAFEERKNTAKRLGEEAGTKMLIPMFLMLAVVLVIIVVPAFLSIQI